MFTQPRTHSLAEQVTKHSSIFQQCYHKIKVLDVNPNPISFLDDTLLFFCLPAHFIFGFVNIMPAIFEPETTSTVAIVKNTLMVREDIESKRLS